MSSNAAAAQQQQHQTTKPNSLDRYVVIHVATTCDEHGVYVTKDSAEVIEIGWILLDANTCDEVRHQTLEKKFVRALILTESQSYIATVPWSSQSTPQSHLSAVGLASDLFSLNRC